MGCISYPILTQLRALQWAHEHGGRLTNDDGPGQGGRTLNHLHTSARRRMHRRVPLAHTEIRTLLLPRAMCIAMSLFLSCTGAPVRARVMSPAMHSAHGGACAPDHVCSRGPSLAQAACRAGAPRGGRAGGFTAYRFDVAGCTCVLGAGYARGALAGLWIIGRASMGRCMPTDEHLHGCCWSVRIAGSRVGGRGGITI